VSGSHHSGRFSPARTHLHRVESCGQTSREFNTIIPLGLDQLCESYRRVEVFSPRGGPNDGSLFVVVTESGGQASARVGKTIGSSIMPKYLFIFRDSTGPKSPLSPEELQALQTAWYAWMQKYKSAIVGGDGLKPSGRLVKAGIVTD